MNRDDIIRMAQEAGIRLASKSDTIDPRNVYLHELERFAELVAAAEREAYQRVHDLIEAHQAALEASEKPGPWPAKEVIAKAVAAEREACALVAERFLLTHSGSKWDADHCAAAIRARGNDEPQ